VCGIFGIATYKTSVPMDRLVRATESMAHRGPDDSGVQLIQGASGIPFEIGLGNRRLAIIDLSPAGHQPMQDPETGNWIVYNGEIYNFQDIRAKLEREGVNFLSQSDTEVVLKAYGKWGEKCLHEFRGMFAFAIWDNDRKRLFLARDRMGIKPLYYSLKDGNLIFASEVRALLESGLVPRRLNPLGLLNYLTFGSAYDPETLIEGINALRAGNYIIWENGRIKEEEYWDIASHQGQPSSKPTILDEKGKKKMLSDFRVILEEAIHLRLVSDVPVGVFLSGGIDSSTIVGLLSKNAPSKVSTFSIVFKELDYNESYYSRIIAKRFDTDHHEILLSQQDAIEAIPNAIRAMDQPTIDGINTYIVSREARRAGLKVALSGLGGDEVFAGYTNFKTIPKMERFTRNWKYIPPTIRILAAKTYAHLVHESDRNLKLTTFIQGNGDIAHPYVLSRLLFTPNQQKRLLTLYDSTIFENANKTLSDTLHRTEQFDSINRVSYLELRNYMLNTLLRDTDFMSMAHGLEVRVPLIDHKVVEYLFTLPGNLKVNAHVPKYLLIKATEDLLPDEVVHRSKRGFTLPFEHWLKDELRNKVESTLLDVRKNSLDEFLNPEGIKEFWQAFLNGHTSWSRPWALYVLEQWCKLYLQ
jgi:asparagine synthase (glutamine-hydrolysing)